MILYLLLIDSVFSLGIQLTNRAGPRASYRAWQGIFSQSTNQLHAQNPTRYRLFKKSFDFVKRISDKESTFTMELNQFSDMTEAERLQYTGLNMTGIEPMTMLLSNQPNLRAPSEVDYRFDVGLTTTRNQKSCGSCWAFSSVAVLESRYKKLTDELLLLSEQELLDCTYDDGRDGCKGGFMTQAFQYVGTGNHLASRLDYGYKRSSSSCKASSYKNALARAKLSSWKQLPSGDQVLKQEIASAGPVSVAIYSSKSLNFYSSGLYSGTGCNGQAVNHAVVVVGYKSDRWIVRNSWGVGWGNNGYVYFSRNINNICGISDFSVTATMVENPPIGDQCSKVPEHHRQSCIDRSFFLVDEWQCKQQGCCWDPNGDTKCFAKGKVTLYSAPYYQGASVTFYGSVPDLYAYDFTGLTQSIIVHEGTWLFYQKENYGKKGGWMIGDYGPGDYENLADSGAHAAITSLRVVPGGDVLTIFEHSSGRGESFSIHQYSPNVGKHWNDEASSAYCSRRWEVCKHSNYNDCTVIDAGLTSQLTCNDCLSSARML